MLGETVYAGARIMFRRDSIESELCAAVHRFLVLGRADGNVVGIAIVVGAIEMRKRRHRKQQARREGVNPTECRKNIALALNIANTRRSLVRSIGDLVIVSACRNNEPQLIGGVKIEDQRSEAAEPPNAIMQHLRPGRLQPVVTSISRDAAEPGEAF